jgi:hypothetical protein
MQRSPTAVEHQAAATERHPPGMELDHHLRSLPVYEGKYCRGNFQGER